MNGLLDFVKTPEGQGLLAAVAGGFANARRGAPLNTIGAAGLSGLTGYARAQDRQQESENAQVNRRFRDMQIGDYERKNQALAQLRGRVGPELAPFVDLDPSTVARSVFKEPEKPQLVTVDTPNGPMQKWMRPGESSGVDVGPTVKKAPEGFEYVNGQLSPIQSYWDQKKSVAAASRQNSPYFTFIPTPEGIVAGDARSGNVSRINLDGKPVVKSTDSPELQGSLAQAKEAGQVTGKVKTEAGFDAPRVVDVSSTALKQVDELLKHPGFTQAVGKSSMLGVQKVPGTEAYDFMSRLDQVKGGAFLEAFNQLKGGGQITEIEGKKATDALARMNNSTSEPEFKAAAEDYKNIIKLGMNRAKMKAGQANTAPTPSSVMKGQVLDGYKFKGGNPADPNAWEKM